MSVSIFENGPTTILCIFESLYYLSFQSVRPHAGASMSNGFSGSRLSAGSSASSHSGRPLPPMPSVLSGGQWEEPETAALANGNTIIVSSQCSLVDDLPEVGRSNLALKLFRFCLLCVVCRASRIISLLKLNGI